jgi:hypothetical protein
MAIPVLDGPAAKLSVVVASCRDVRLLDACLASLYGQCGDLDAEIVVARAGGAETAGHLVERYPGVRMIECPAGSGIPELRAMGLRAAAGHVVALTEDHCVAAAGWLAALASGHQSGADVVGGAMRNAQQRRSVDWGAYFAEYGFFAASSTDSAPLLTGANVAYGRDCAIEAARLAGEGAWENVVHARLLEHGRTLRFIDSAVIAQNQNYAFFTFCRDRYEHGRDYARVRLVSEGRRRWLYMFVSFALPFILTMRVARINAVREPASFARALPFTFAFLSAWSAGEMVGYWLGAAESAGGHG